MTNFKINYFNPLKPKDQFHFYVLCKGLNSGKPLTIPCPNSFIIICTSKSQVDFLSKLCFALWKSKYFHSFLTGSVIPFLRISDFKIILAKFSQTMSENPAAFLQDVQKVVTIETHESILQQQLKLIQQLKVAMLTRHFKPSQYGLLNTKKHLP